MPIGAITMILTNVGLQIYNNWCSSKQNAKLQEKCEEFERAVRERNTERMWKLMREGQKLTLQLEEEKHQQRLDELKNDVSNLLKKLAYSETINNWPLNVLPVVMKNQALGNLLANQEERIALHCIFTPSNCNEFNKNVFPLLEKELEQYCNQYWSIIGDHPILFYSGAWSSNTSPTDVQIDSMRVALSNLPTLLITPFFRPSDGHLVFQVSIWGVDASSSDEFNVPEIEPINFQRIYTNKLDYAKEPDVIAEMTEDIVPYIQCSMIGYMADTYFWSSMGVPPILPKFIKNGIVHTDGLNYLVKDSQEYYMQLLTCSEKKSLEQPFTEDYLLTLFEGISPLWNKNIMEIKLEEIFVTYCNKRFRRNFVDMDEALKADMFTKYDLSFIKSFSTLYKYGKFAITINELAVELSYTDFDYSILKITDISTLESLIKKNNNAIAMYRLGEIYEFSISSRYNKSLSDKFYEMSYHNKFILALCQHDSSNFKTFERSLKYLCQADVIQAWVIMVKFHINEFASFPTKIVPESIIKIHPYLMYQLAKLYINSNMNTSTAEQLLVNSADNGYIQSQELLCKLYKDGNVLNENPLSHVHYAELGMLQNSPECTFAMAMCYMNGYGVAQSTSTAMLLFNRSLELGHPEAQRLKKLLNSI